MPASTSKGLHPLRGSERRPAEGARAVGPADPKEQMKLYEEAQVMIARDVPSIYVANPLHRIAFRDNVKGYRFVGLVGFDVAFYDFTIVR